MEKHFREHFGMFVNKIQNNEPFAFARYSDGELFILQNKVLKLAGDVYQVDDRVHPSIYKSEDHKEFNPEIHSEFREKLIEAYKYKQANYYKGISCSCCVGKEAFDFQIDLHGGDDESLTWANLWVNGNYPLFIMNTLPILYSKDCVFVGHESADTSKLPFIKKDFRVGYNAFINDYDKIEIIRKWIKENNITNHVFLFSASTFTNLAVYELFRDFPNNSYIDIGTCLTPMMNMPTHRGYLEAFWGYRGGPDIQKICIWN
jgi:hypothetical protein